jgi:hypothetical protein
LHKACVLDFLEKVRASDYSNYRGYEALSRAVIVDACYASAEAGHEVSLN